MSNLKLANHQYKFSAIVSKDDSHFKFVFTKKAKDILSLMHSLVQCQLGVLPLGTGNDLSRVLGWGTSFDDDTAVTQFLRHLERAKAAVLDR